GSALVIPLRATNSARRRIVVHSSFDPCATNVDLNVVVSKCRAFASAVPAGSVIAFFLDVVRSTPASAGKGRLACRTLEAEFSCIVDLLSDVFDADVQKRVDDDVAGGSQVDVAVTCFVLDGNVMGVRTAETKPRLASLTDAQRKERQVRMIKT